MNPGFTVAVVSTPLHLRSLIRNASDMQWSRPLHVFFIGMRLDEARAAYYRRVLREQGPPCVEYVFSGTAASRVAFVFTVFFLALRSRFALRLVVGNPRIWQSLFVARFATAIEALEEGIGTTREHGYFDPRTEERSRVKRLLVAAGLLRSYPEVVRLIEAHHTSLPWSVLGTRRAVEFRDSRFVPADLVASAPARVAVLVVSLARFVGFSRYEARVRTLLDAGWERSHIWVCAHPMDDPSAVGAFARSHGILYPELEVVLEDLLVGLLDSGREVHVVGDRNSSVALVEAMRLPAWQLQVDVDANPRVKG